MAKFKVGDVVTDRNGVAWKVDGVFESTDEYLVHMVDSPSDRGRMEERMLKGFSGSQKFNVGDKVLDEYGDPWTIVQRHPGKKSYILKPIGFSAPNEEKHESKLTRLNSAPRSSNPVVQNALNRRVALNFGEFHVGAKIKVGSRIGTIVKMHGFNDLLADVRFDDGEVKTDINILRPEVRPLNSVVANAAVADTDRVKVVCETETLFGTRREEKTMTVAELRAAFAKVGSSRLFNDVMNDFGSGRDANPLLRLPCETWITRP